MTHLTATVILLIISSSVLFVFGDANWLNPKENRDFYAKFIKKPGVTTKVDIGMGGVFGRGLTAKVDINPGEIVLHIPSEYTINSRKALRDLIEDGILDLNSLPKDGSDSALYLALWLVQEKSKGENSKYNDYIRILPSTYSTYSYWSDSEKKSWSERMSPVIDYPLEDLDTFPKEIFKTVDTLVSSSEKSKWTEEDFKWALATIFSRTVAVGKSLLFHPLSDFANHKNGSGKIIVRDDGSVDVVSNVAVEKGKQVFVEYPQLNNFQFVRFWGFLPEDNPHDGFVVNLPLKEETPFQSSISNILTKYGMNTSSFVLDRNGNIPLEMLARQMVLSLTPMDLKDVSKESLTKMHINTANKLLATQILYRKLKLLLKSFPTTINDDSKELEKSTGPGYKAAIGVLLEHKKILSKSLVKLANLWVQYLKDLNISVK